jgi:hypothetical protein
VIRVEGSVITVNSGQKDQLQPGQTLYVSRMGQPVAEIKIEAVGEFSSRARLQKNLGTSYVLAGDQVQSQAPLSSAAVPSSTIASVPVKPGGFVPPPVAVAAPPGPLQLTAEEAEESYRDELNSRTKKRTFRQKNSARSGVSTQAAGMQAISTGMEVDALASGFANGGFYGSPGMLIFSAGAAVEAQHQRDLIFGQIEAECKIEATYWDLPLMEKYAQYVAVTSGKTSPGAYATLRSSLIAQKGIDNCEVFEVRLKNTGKTHVQLSPFHWHMFLMGPNNSRVAATRYDQVLDRLLNPGEEVAGNIYFQKMPTLGDKVTIFYEDVYGVKGTEDFPLH